MKAKTLANMLLRVPEAEVFIPDFDNGWNTDRKAFVWPVTGITYNKGDVELFADEL